MERGVPDEIHCGQTRQKFAVLFFFSPSFDSNGVHAACDIGLRALQRFVAIDETVRVLNDLVAELDAHALFGNRTKQGLDPRLHFVHGGVVAEVRQ